MQLWEKKSSIWWEDWENPCIEWNLGCQFLKPSCISRNRSESCDWEVNNYFPWMENFSSFRFEKVFSTFSADVGVSANYWPSSLFGETKIVIPRNLNYKIVTHRLPRFIITTWTTGIQRRKPYVAMSFRIFFSPKISKSQLFQRTLASTYMRPSNTLKASSYIIKYCTFVGSLTVFSSASKRHKTGSVYFNTLLEFLITNGINHNVAFFSNLLRYQRTRSTYVRRLLVSKQNDYFFKTRWAIQRRSCGDEEVSVSAKMKFTISCPIIMIRNDRLVIVLTPCSCLLLLTNAKWIRCNRDARFTKQFLDKRPNDDSKPLYSEHKVRVLVDLVERMLFANASSLEEYSDTSTLEERFRYIVVRFIQQKFKARRKHNSQARLLANALVVTKERKTIEGLNERASLDLQEVQRSFERLHLQRRRGMISPTSARSKMSIRRPGLRPV